VLVAMAAQCEGGHVPKCPIVDALFEPHARGARVPVSKGKRPSE
jgi:hypothetical protein